MFQDANGLPVAGGTLAAALIYAGVSLFITGPVIGQRTIEKSDWAGQCQRHIRAEVERQSPEPPALPKLDCDTLFGNWFGRQGREYCEHYGPQFGNPLGGLIDGIQQQKQAAHKKRMEYAASRAGSRCECAVTLTLEKRRTDFALYAGTLRLVTPPSVKALSSELKSSLNSETCALKG